MCSFALLLFVGGMMFRYMYNQGELFILTMILSTIFFFVSGACFLLVTYVDPVTGTVTAVETYNFLVWLMVPFGFVPIFFMYEWGFDDMGDKE
jgi:hypothetical protein